MAIASRLDPSTQVTLVAGKFDPVVRLDVTSPYRVTSARRHRRRSTTDRADVLKIETLEALLADDLPESLPAPASVEPAAPAVAVTTQPARREPISFSQPSWIVVAAAAATVGFIVWWVMFERLPDIDPRQVVATNLSAAQQAFAEQRYVDPAERSAFHYYTTVLSLDPLNVDARKGIDRIADIYVEEAKTRLIAGRLADAGLALDRARRARPDHPQLPRLNELLRGELTQILAQAHAQSVEAQAQLATKTASEQQSAPFAPKRELSVERVLRSAPVPTAKPLKLAQLDTARGLIGESQSMLDLAIAQPAAGSAGASTAKASSQPKVVKFVQPVYPNDALMRGIQGWVDVSLRVSPSGDVVDPRVENSTRGRLFERSALNAVRQWRYEPHAAGDPLDSERLQVRVEFRLTK